ncbi:MAG: choice-of-anchor P family protein [Acidimicrobiia bacterium]
METTEQTRRDFIKKGAMVGGVAWAAPTILSIGTAHAQTALYECCPNCQAAATGLRVSAPLVGTVSFGVATGPSQTCNPVTATGTIIDSGVACGAANSDQCTASGELVGSATDPNVPATITVGGVVITATVLRGEVRCGPNGLEGSSTIVGLTVNGAPVTLASNCQLVISLPGVTVTVNEQTCDDGRLTVRALHVSAPLIGTDVVAGEAIAGAPGCTCVAAPRC